MRSVQINGKQFSHPYDFDPTYGYDLKKLLSIEPPEEPAEFAHFWKRRYDRARNQSPELCLVNQRELSSAWKVADISYRSTDSFTLGGWALLPSKGHIRRGFVVGHGYGGRDLPDIALPFPDSVIFFPCARGISRSKDPRLPEDPNRHVAHGIEDKETYVIGGCVDDLWIAVSAMLEGFPEVESSLHVLGVSFSGGTTMLAAPWDHRIQSCHVNVPTFGHQQLRLSLPTVGSGAGAQAFEKRNPGVASRTLAFFDAATAAKYAQAPSHCACALFDPAVAPPGQYAIYNALPPTVRQRFDLTAGHHEYPGKGDEDARLLQELCAFFEN
ncbi:acetylxylan esterase [Pelagicoccus sp. SDUM812003]|uniref:acetylxylan esterase n=1 Tax=Pelagicoccus sp. SDUM812003 TaxID=3041267 RepID=UPI00280F4FF7|nr:acetylxylan esterase [Pelagicoccus sp. SDUM812003]MDQ8203948.1 acetylxylan esterase [Pelagicoccus sp. SDUM812003]